MKTDFEGGASNWLAAGLALFLRREHAAVLALIADAECRLERLRSGFAALDGPGAVLERLHDLLGNATGKIPAADIWAALGTPIVGYRTQRDNEQLGRAMRRLGWTRTMQRFDGPPQSAYVKGSAEERRRAIYLIQCPLTGEWQLVPG